MFIYFYRTICVYDVPSSIFVNELPTTSAILFGIISRGKTAPNYSL